MNDQLMENVVYPLAVLAAAAVAGGFMRWMWTVTTTLHDNKAIGHNIDVRLGAVSKQLESLPTINAKLDIQTQILEEHRQDDDRRFARIEQRLDEAFDFRMAGHARAGGN